MKSLLSLNGFVNVNIHHNNTIKMNGIRNISLVLIDSVSTKYFVSRVIVLSGRHLDVTTWITGRIHPITNL